MESLSPKLRAKLELEQEVLELGLYDESKDEAWNKPVISKAKALFLQDYPYERIFMLTGLPPHIWYKYEKSWRRLKKRLINRIVKEAEKGELAKDAKRVAKLGAKFANQWFIKKFLDPDSLNMNPKDFSAVMKGAKDMYEISQLEQSLPTEITKAYEHLNLAEMREFQAEMSKLMQKEYGDVVDYIDVDVVPVEEELRGLPYEQKRETATTPDSSTD